jgi:hypothetical protein
MAIIISGLILRLPLTFYELTWVVKFDRPVGPLNARLLVPVSRPCSGPHTFGPHRYHSQACPFEQFLSLLASRFGSYDPSIAIAYVQLIRVHLVGPDHELRSSYSGLCVEVRIILTICNTYAALSLSLTSYDHLGYLLHLILFLVYIPVQMDLSIRLFN